MAKQKEKTLTQKQKLFCEKYIENGFNGTQAYLDVYTNTTETSVASSCACKMLKLPYICEYIQELIRTYVSQELTPNRILYEIMDIAFNHELDERIRLDALGRLAKLMGMEVTKVQMEQIVFVGEAEMMD